MVLAAQLSFDSERYFCYLVREEQSARGPRGASAGAALSLAQLPAVRPSYSYSQYITVELRLLVYLISAGVAAGLADRIWTVKELLTTVVSPVNA